MKNFMIMLGSLLVLASTAHAAVQPYYQDIKLPTQQMIEKQSWTNPLATTTTTLLNVANGTLGVGASTVSSFAGQPDFARNLVLTPVGTTSNQNLCTVVINGLNYNGHAMSENFAVPAGMSTAVTGAKAFASVSSVVFPAGCVATPFGTRYDLGLGSKLGVKRCEDATADMLHGAANGIKEATAPTMAADSSVLESNTATFNTSLNGTNDFDLFFIQNFRCVR